MPQPSNPIPPPLRTPPPRAEAPAPSPAGSTHLEVADVLEHEGVVDVDLLADLVVHGVHVGLVHGHALLGQGRRVVDGDVVQLGVVLPVLVCRGRRTQAPLGVWVSQFREQVTPIISFRIRTCILIKS